MDATAKPVLSGSRSKRHYRTAEEKRRIVEETLLPGVSVAAVARAQGVNANLVFHWRKLYQAGLLGDRPATSVGEASARCVRLLPVTVAEDAQNKQPGRNGWCRSSNERTSLYQISDEQWQRNGP